MTTHQTWTIAENSTMAILVVDDVDHRNRTGLIAQAGDERTSVPLSAPSVAALVRALLTASPGARQMAADMLAADAAEEALT